MDSTIRAARAALHMWEEPCISGKKGSGAVFFSGCGLRCCFCQNRDIAIGDSGKEISVERLAEIFWNCRKKGRANRESGRLGRIMCRILFRRWSWPEERE